MRINNYDITMVHISIFTGAQVVQVHRWHMKPVDDNSENYIKVVKSLNDHTSDITRHFMT